MNPQVFTSLGAMPQPNLFIPIKNPVDPPHKPLTGGLWTSTYCPEMGSDWIKFALRILPGRVQKENLWLLTPKPDANVFTIDSLLDLQRLVAQYEARDHPFKELGVKFFALIDFEALAAAGYDAIHLTKRGQIQTHMTLLFGSDLPTLYGWDVECTYWLRWAFDEVEQLPWQDEWER